LYDAALAALMRWPCVDSPSCAAPHREHCQDVRIMARALSIVLNCSSPSCQHSSLSAVSSSAGGEHKERITCATAHRSDMHDECISSSCTCALDESVSSLSNHMHKECTNSGCTHAHNQSSSGAMGACATFPKARNQDWASSQLFALGGRDTHWRGVTCTAAYNAVRDEWQSGPSLPHSMQYVRSVGLNAVLYAFGNMFQPLQMHMGWNWQNKKWRTVPAEGSIVWRQLQYMEAVAVDSEVWIIGGRSMPNNVRCCQSCCCFKALEAAKGNQK
jgi:hypothetical protein